MVAAAALAHLHKHHRAIGHLHDQVNFAAAPPGRPIIALQQAQTARLQKSQRLVFACIATGFGGGAHRLFFEELH
jgi:hypothetical protein